VKTERKKNGDVLLKSLKGNHEENGEAAAHGGCGAKAKALISQ